MEHPLGPKTIDTQLLQWIPWQSGAPGSPSGASLCTAAGCRGQGRDKARLECPYIL